MRTLQEVEKDIADIKGQLENVKGGDTEVYARIVGYYRSVRNWNKGKREEYGIRKMFELQNGDNADYTVSNCGTCQNEDQADGLAC